MICKISPYNKENIRTIAPRKDLDFYLNIVMSNIFVFVYLSFGVMFLICLILCWILIQFTRPAPGIYRLVRNDIDRINERFSDIMRLIIKCSYSFDIMNRPISFIWVKMIPVVYSRN